MQLHNWRLPLLTMLKQLWAFLRSSSYLLHMELHGRAQGNTSYGTEKDVSMYICVCACVCAHVCVHRTFMKGLNNLVFGNCVYISSFTPKLCILNSGFKHTTLSVKVLKKLCHSNGNSLVICELVICTKCIIRESRYK